MKERNRENRRRLDAKDSMRKRRNSLPLFNIGFSAQKCVGKITKIDQSENNLFISYRLCYKTMPGHRHRTFDNFPYHTSKIVRASSINSYSVLKTTR